jgi:hypothetical protein
VDEVVAEVAVAVEGDHLIIIMAVTPVGEVVVNLVLALLREIEVTQLREGVEGIVPEVVEITTEDESEGEVVVGAVVVEAEVVTVVVAGGEDEEVVDHERQAT